MNKTSEQERRGENISFERIRRITGYLVGTTDRWNNAKKAELANRVKHGLDTQGCLAARFPLES